MDKQATSKIENNKFFSDRFFFISTALEKLFTNQEKNYGCFQVKKEDDCCRLEIAHLPLLRLYKNESNHIYKVYWQQTEEDERRLANLSVKKIEGNKDNKEPAIRVRKKQKKVYDLGAPNTERIQKNYEVVIKYDSRPEIQKINKLLANFIQEKIRETLISQGIDEKQSLVTIVEET
jgi:hypothetical protein